VQPAFHPARFPAYADVIRGQVDAVLDTWHDGQRIDLFAEMKVITARIGLLTMFTYMQPDWVLSQALRDSIVVMDGLFRRIVAPSFVNRLPTPDNLRFNRANARLRTVVDRIIDEYRRHGVNCGDMLSSMLNVEECSSSAGITAEEITNTDVHDEVTVFFLAAMDTTAAALAWTLTELMRHPDVRDRLLREFDSVLAGRPAGLDDLPKLTLTNQVAHEILRLHPPVWLLTRIVTTDTELAGRPVKAGTTLFISPYVVHQREEVFAHPGRFDPDRWAEPNLTRQARSSLMPFGFGARKCIGSVFGMTELTLALTRIIPRWHLEPDPRDTARSSTSFVLSPRRSRARLRRIG
jgi:pentalenene oxygenase